MKTSSLAFKINAAILLIFLIGLVVTVVALIEFNVSKNQAQTTSEVAMPLAEQALHLTEESNRMRLRARTYSIQETVEDYDATYGY